MTAYEKEPVEEGIARICHRYLGNPAKEEDTRLVFVCPSCGNATFALNLITQKAGCWTGRCPPGRYADALDLIMHFEQLASFPEALKCGYEILGLPKPGRGPAHQGRSPEPEETERQRASTGRQENAQDNPSTATDGSREFAKSEDAGHDDGSKIRTNDLKGGWYAVLGEEWGGTSDSSGTRPEVYQPAGAMRPLPSSVATRVEIAAALIALVVGMVCTWHLVGYAATVFSPTPALKVIHTLAEHRLVAALADGILAAFLVWSNLSSRRSAERRHLGEAEDDPRGSLSRCLAALRRLSGRIGSAARRHLGHAVLRGRRALMEARKDGTRPERVAKRAKHRVRRNKG